MKNYFAESLWSPQGWTRDAHLAVDAGRVVAAPADAGAERLGRYVLPGMPNLHSHAFQRAMAGLAERQTNPGDSFWTWRETMYAFASRIGPDDLRAIAAQLYVEMLEAGYTQVCEFHYLHHQPNGQPYADPAAMSLALIEAAREAGIGLTLLPTLYMTGGFDGRALSERQRRFGFDVDGYLSLLRQLVKMENAALRVGVALHSLRAVPERAMREVLEAISLLPSGEGARRADEGPGLHRGGGMAEPSPQPLSRGERGSGMPVHIHIAEQIGEVQDCLALRNARPVEWLLDNMPVDARWCLVHATHMSAQETQRLAQSGAVAGLCPTTEANLGDGLFPLKAYLDEDGAFGVGSDSHISVSPVEELRWLEYGQRLATRHRNIAVSAANHSVGETLFGAALRGGARAAGVALGAIEAGKRADFVVLDEQSALLAGRDRASLIDTFLFAGNTNLVRHVMVNGDWVVRDFRHRDRDRIGARYRETVERLATSN
ncbi:MAG: formimidoylglutamate deiminase [Proteobacteria bacterium]|nr:formimidoylglutamate deiminase [Pseudomonadota bacterium]